MEKEGIRRNKMLVRVSKVGQSFTNPRCAIFALLLLVTISLISFDKPVRFAANREKSPITARPAKDAANNPLQHAWPSGVVGSLATDKQQLQVRLPGVNSPDRVHAIVGRSAKNSVSPPLRDIKPLPPTQQHPIHELEEEHLPLSALAGGRGREREHDPVVQNWFSPLGSGSLGALAIPSPRSSWEGVNAIWRSSPPDTTGDIGPNHYIQVLNFGFQIWNKTGASLYGPANLNTQWQGFGGPCETDTGFDPVVLYDSFADRWLIHRVSPFPTAQNYYSCIAISASGDPLGEWDLYAFPLGGQDFYDYSKLGVWADGYYLSSNRSSSSAFLGPAAVVFDRANMLAGQPAAFQQFNIDPLYCALLPADLDGTRLPPAGSPNYYATIINGVPNTISLWRFHVDWGTHANSTFTGPINLATAPSNQWVCGGSWDCIPQPGTAQKLEPLSAWLMYRLVYRNFGDHEALVTNQTVDADGTGHAGVRWYEIRDPGASPYVYQQGTYAPDSNHRWMGSIAMDHAGDIALGYSVSSSSVYPSIRYTGRRASDPLGTMPQGEGVLIAGGGSQTDTNRWGDYSMMTIDPVDGCSFWYTTEYYQTTSAANWHTRIGSFRFPSCRTFTPTPTFTGTPRTSTPTHTPTNTRTATATATRTNTPAPPPACGPGSNYVIEQSGGATIYPDGKTLIANSRCGYCTVSIQLPFTFNLYGQPFSQVNASSSGSLLFGSNNIPVDSTCLPNRLVSSAIFAYWYRLLTNETPTQGIFTSVTGIAPNRAFNIEWRACEYAAGSCGGDVNFEVRLYEQASPGQGDRFDMVYATVLFGGSDATIGVQSDAVSFRGFTQYSCHTTSLSDGWQLTFREPACGTPTQTNTPTNTPTSTRISMLTATSTTTPALAPVLMGHVSWQGRPAQPNSLQQLPITLTLRAGATETDFSTATTDANGSFTVTVDGLAPGIYDWRVKGPKYLANSGTIMLTGTSTTGAEMGLMKVGDCNNDNIVTIADFNILRPTFGRQSGDPGYDDRADFTGDLLVNVTDFNLLRGNFGVGGSPPIRMWERR